ncbi:hypothetical protein M8562_001226 [Campylobacter upsaliensis]|nr:hypothetical protein [Campylobacter upsaliensis]
MSNFIQELKDKAQGLTLTREQYIIKATFELHQIALNYDDEKLIESLAKLCSYALILDFDIDESEFELGDRQDIVELVLLNLYESLMNEPFSNKNGLFHICFNALKFLGAEVLKKLRKLWIMKGVAMDINSFHILILFSLAIAVILLIVVLVRYLHETAEWREEKSDNGEIVVNYNTIGNNTQDSRKKAISLLKNIIFFNTNHDIVRNLKKVSKQLEELNRNNNSNK